MSHVTSAAPFSEQRQELRFSTPLTPRRLIWVSRWKENTLEEALCERKESKADPGPAWIRRVFTYVYRQVDGCLKAARKSQGSA